MSVRAWFLRSSLRQVAITTGAIGFVLLLPFAVVFSGAPANTRWAVFTQAGFQAGLLAGLVGALRLQRGSGQRWRHALRAFARGAVLSVSAAAGVALAIVVGLGLEGLNNFSGSRGMLRAGTDPWVETASTIVISGFAAVATLVAFTLVRATLLAWSRWDAMRRTRLRWALTNSLLIASLVVAFILATIGTTAGVMSGFRPNELSITSGLELRGAQSFFAAVVFQAVPIVIFPFLGAFIIGIVIVPPVAAIAFPVLGRATRRLEALAAATSALRAGQLAARTPVTGEDEIARLQADFNAMATDLERTLGELRAERDAVRRLLGARRELVASVSHELRTPLATLRGYLDSALEHWDDSASSELRRDLEIMSAETDRLHHLVDDLFTLSRAEVGRLPMTLQPTAIAPLLRGIVATAALAWQQGRVEVVTDVGDGLPAVHADPERLEQIVRNLVTNAVRHTPPGGLVLLAAVPAGDALLIQVRDTGEGIAAADLPLIWDRFYRAGNAAERSGAGLGLALVKELTEAMGGTVTAESAPGEGSCFTVRLPLVQATPAVNGPRTSFPAQTSI